MSKIAESQVALAATDVEASICVIRNEIDDLTVITAVVVPFWVVEFRYLVEVAFHQVIVFHVPLPLVRFFFHVFPAYGRYFCVTCASPLTQYRRSLVPSDGASFPQTLIPGKLFPDSGLTHNHVLALPKRKASGMLSVNPSNRVGSLDCGGPLDR